LVSKGKLSLWVAAVLAIGALTFPWVRATGLFPTEALVGQVARLSSGRADSLAFRFDNEDALLERAEQRPLFGWGPYGRSRIYDEYGRSQTVTDGWWIIQYGTFGLVGFLFAFGLLLSPIVIVLRRWKRFVGGEDRIVMGTMSLIVAVRVVELLPNGLFSFLPFFLSGALAGIAGGSVQAAPAEVQPEGHDADWKDRGRTRPRPRGQSHQGDAKGAARRRSSWE
jgi:O-antigen ligase